MTQRYRNPYHQKSKFQYSHPISSSLSTTSLFLPTVSICPRKKYSSESWYDYKSSNPQLSEKVLYRMQANFYALQSKGVAQQQYQHIENCLLSCQCKKNPFHKSSLLDLHALNNSQSFNKESGLHWTDQKYKKNLWAHQSHQTSVQTLNQYGELRKKQLAIKQKFHFNSTHNFLKGTGNFGTSGQSKLPSQVEQRPPPSMMDNNISSKTVQKQRELKQSERVFFFKKSSGSTFGYRRSSQQIPEKITYQDKQFFFVKLGIENT